MNGSRRRININFQQAAARAGISLLLGAALASLLISLSGCRTAEERADRKKVSTIALHLEANKDATDRQMLVPIYRQTPVQVSVMREPFLDTANVLQASVIEHPGQGIGIALQMDRQGTLILNNVTSAYRGRSIAVFARFEGPDFEDTRAVEARWIAAPVANTRITDGVFVFTPDADKEEAERFVLGLNNAARKLHGKAAGSKP